MFQQPSNFISGEPHLFRRFLLNKSVIYQSENPEINFFDTSPPLCFPPHLPELNCQKIAPNNCIPKEERKQFNKRQPTLKEMLREIEEMHSRKTSLLVSAEKAEQIKFPVLTGGAKTYPTVANLVETKSLNLHYESMLELLAKKIVAKNHSGIEKFLFQEDAKLRGNDSVNLKLIAQTHRIQNDFNRSKIVNKSKEKWISRMKPYEPRHSGAFYETPGKLESILRFKADFKEQIPRFIDSAESDLLRPQSFTPNFFASKSVAVENTGFLQLPIYHA